MPKLECASGTHSKNVEFLVFHGIRAQVIDSLFMCLIILSLIGPLFRIPRISDEAPHGERFVRWYRNKGVRCKPLQSINSFLMASQWKKYFWHILSQAIGIANHDRIGNAEGQKTMASVESYRILDCIHVGCDQQVLNWDGSPFHLYNIYNMQWFC